MTVVMDRALSPEQQAVLDSARPEELAQVKQWLEDRNQALTPYAIAGRLLTVREHVEANRRKATKRRALDELLATDPAGPRSAHLVKACRDKFGWGPTWAELARAMGWGCTQSQQTIHALARVGWLSFTREPRSLRPGPRAIDPTWRPKTKPHRTTTQRRSTR